MRMLLALMLGGALSLAVADPLPSWTDGPAKQAATTFVTAFIDDKDGKPVGIQRPIGRRPILAFGNSDGDLPMLQLTTGAPGRRLALILHHTDGEREYAYDRESHFGKLDQALDLAAANDRVLDSMKDDWTQIFAPVKP